MVTAERIKELFHLEPLPGEGGYFRETYRSATKLAGSCLPGSYTGDRNIATAIFFLLTSDTHSALHVLPTDELWHFYLGDPVEMLQLHPDGTGDTFIIGQDFEKGMKLQLRVPGQTWQGSRLVPGGEWALMGTTMAPGFEFQDFRAADRDELVSRYPRFRNSIIDLTENPK